MKLNKFQLYEREELEENSEFMEQNLPSSRSGSWRIDHWMIATIMAFPLCE